MAVQPARVVVKAHTPLDLHCPAGCGPTLSYVVGAGVVCVAQECPEPEALSKLLSEHVHYHEVEIEGDWWTAKHPLIERLDDRIFECGIQEWAHRHKGQDGHWYVRQTEEGWEMLRMEDR